MPSQLYHVIFSCLLSAICFTAYGQERCVQIFSHRSQFLEIDAELELKKVESVPLSSHRWVELSTMINRNRVDLIHLENISVVVKWGRRAHQFEPLGYQIAKLINVNVPTTVPIKHDKLLGAAQVYIPGNVTLLEVSGRFTQEVNPAILLFDRLTLNSDRNPGNILVPAELSQRSQKTQTPIDHELIFDMSSPRVIEYLSEGPGQFLKDNIKLIKEQYPDVHQAMLDPFTKAKVLALMKGEKYLGEAEIRYVETFFQAYLATNRPLDIID